MNIAAGIDVGASGKGFHAVALRNGRYLDKFHAARVSEVATWVRRMGARAIAIDAPCHWRIGGRMREAERALARLRIHCFATPGRATGQRHAFYAWMRNGMSLYRGLSARYPLAVRALRSRRRVSFETFPHAIARMLQGRPLSARDKRRDRRRLLEDAGIDTSRLSSIDFLDAALCALSAHRYLMGSAQVLGDAQGGYIVLPAPSRPG